MATTRTKRNTKPAVVTDELDDIEELEIDETPEVEEDEAPAPKKRTRKAAAKKVVEPEPEDEDEDEDEDEEPAPVKKPAKKAAGKKAAPAKEADAELGTAWLTEHVNETLGTSHTAFTLRGLLRKLAKQGKLDREVGADRSRYTFTGPNDVTVKSVIKAIKNGDLEKDKKEALDKLKEKSAAKRAAKKAAVEVDEDDVEDLEDDE